MLSKEEIYRGKIIEQKKRTIIVRKEKKILQEKLVVEINTQIQLLENIERLIKENEELKKKAAPVKEGLVYKEIDEKKLNEEIMVREKQFKELKKEIQSLYMYNAEFKEEIKELKKKIL